MLVKILGIKATRLGNARTLTTDQGKVMIGGKLSGVDVSVGFSYIIEVNKVESDNPKYPGSSLWVASIQPANQLPPIQPGSAVKEPLQVIRTDNPKQVEVKQDSINRSVALNNACMMTLAMSNAIKDQFAKMTAKEVYDYLHSVQKTYYKQYFALLTGRVDDGLVEMAEEVSMDDSDGGF